MNKRKLVALAVFILTLFLMVPVFAEEPQAQTPEDTTVTSQGQLQESLEEGKVKLTLALPKELKGYDLQVQDADGNTTDTVKIDSSGKGVVKLTSGTQYFTLTLNTEKPVSLGTVNDSHEYGLFDIILYAVITGIAVYFLTKFITKHKIMKQLHGLRGYIYEENLD